MGHRLSKYQQRTPAAITTSSVQTSAAAAAAAAAAVTAVASTAASTIPSATKVKQHKRKKDAVTKQQRKQRTHASAPAPTAHGVPSPFSIQTATGSDRLLHLSNNVWNERIATTKPTIESNLINNIDKQHLSTSSIRSAALVHQQQFESLTSSGNSVVITIRMLKMESNELTSLVQQRQQSENGISESSSTVNAKHNNNNINLNNNHNTTSNSGSISNNIFFNKNHSNLNKNNQVMDNRECCSDMTRASKVEFDKYEDSAQRELLNDCCSRTTENNNINNSHPHTLINQNSNENNELVASTTASVNSSNNNFISIATNLDDSTQNVDSNDLRIVEDEIAIDLPSKKSQQQPHNFICDNSINDKQDSASPLLDWSIQSTSSMAMINAMTNKLNQANITATTSTARIDSIPAEIINSVSPYPHHIPIGNIHHHDCITAECKQ